MSNPATSHQDVKSISEADRIALEKGCTHRSALMVGNLRLGACYWKTGDETDLEMAVYYATLQVLDIWNAPKPSPMPEAVQELETL